MQQPTSILVWEGCALVRRALAEWLCESKNLHIVGTADSEQTAQVLAAQYKPDVILLQIELCSPEACRSISVIHRSSPDSRLIFLGSFSDSSYVSKAMELGAVGYLTNYLNPMVVTDAIHQVMTGQTAFPTRENQTISLASGDDFQSQALSETESALSAREAEVLQLIANGLSKKEIAIQLHLSVKTVDRHSSNIMAKLNLHDRVQLTRYAIRHGIITA